VRVFVDECVNRRLVRHIVGHDIKTARQMGWTSIKNGVLLAMCEPQFDVFVTIDKNLPHQQNLSGLDLAVVVLRARSNRLKDLLPLVPDLLAAISGSAKGVATFVGGAADA
jgi:hypothetical protein